jgi:hypothetical protein
MWLWLQIAANGIFITLLVAVIFSDAFWKSGKFYRVRNVIVHFCVYLNCLFVLLLIVLFCMADK